MRINCNGLVGTEICTLQKVAIVELVHVPRAEITTGAECTFLKGKEKHMYSTYQILLMG